MQFLTLRMSRMLLSICSFRKNYFLPASIIILFCFIWDEIFYSFDGTMVKMKAVESKMQQ